MVFRIISNAQLREEDGISSPPNTLSHELSTHLQPTGNSTQKDGPDSHPHPDPGSQIDQVSAEIATVFQ